MIKKLKLYISDRLDPYYNMSVERYLTESAGTGECILYLWRNERTVFVGRNQNCFAECRVSVLEADGGRLCRRMSGGGAVYHDAGNLNFSFIAGRDDYNVQKQCSVVATALKRFGLSAEVSGRNDILVGGAKFSGNAFWCCGDNYLHHGTILIRTDVSAMEKYLNVPADKLKSKGVASVRSRVVNLGELCRDINAESMADALTDAFEEVYCLPLSYEKMPTDQDISEIRAEFESPEWKYGRTPAFTHSFRRRFEWGSVGFELDVREGIIRDIGVYSDSLDSELFAVLPEYLRGCRYDPAAMCDAAARLDAHGENAGKIISDIQSLFREEI